MSESPDKWAAFWKNLQLVVGALLAVTAAAFFDILGVMGLAIVWAVLYAVVATVYAVRFRSEAREARITVLGPTRPNGEDSSKVKRLESDLTKTRVIAEQLMVDRSELRKQLRSVESQEAGVERRELENAKLRERIEELETLQSSRMDLADELRKQLRRIPNLRKYEAPLRGAQRKNYLLWHRRTIMLLEQAFDKGSDPVEEFEEIEFESEGLVTFPDDDYARGLDEAEVFLRVHLEQFEEY